MKIIELNPKKGMSRAELKQAYFESFVNSAQSLDLNLELLENLFNDSLNIHLMKGKIIEYEIGFYMNPDNGKYCIK